jgi:LysR family carnitine catabolism transcriptional activator
MNITQRQLRMFTLIAATRSFSRASEALHLSQPALSRAFQEFESQLGTTLLDRTTRQLRLTAEGKRFLPIAQRLLSDMSHAVEAIRNEAHGIGGTAAVAVGTAFACTVMPPVLRDFALQHPAVRLNLRDDNSRGITERVMHAEVDFGIGSVVGDSEALSLTRLLTAPIGLVAHPKHHPLPAKLSVDRLMQLPLLKETDDTSIMNLLRLHGSDVVVMMERGMEVSSLAVQLALAHAGVGVAVMSALGASHPAASALRFVPLAPAIRREVFLMHRRDRPLRPPAQALATAIVEALASATLHPLVAVSAAE